MASGSLLQSKNLNRLNVLNLLGANDSKDDEIIENQDEIKKTLDELQSDLTQTLTALGLNSDQQANFYNALVRATGNKFNNGSALPILYSTFNYFAVYFLAPWLVPLGLLGFLNRGLTPQSGTTCPGVYNTDAMALRTPDITKLQNIDLDVWFPIPPPFPFNTFKYTVSGQPKIEKFLEDPDYIELQKLLDFVLTLEAPFTRSTTGFNKSSSVINNNGTKSLKLYIDEFNFYEGSGIFTFLPDLEVLEQKTKQYINPIQVPWTNEQISSPQINYGEQEYSIIKQKAQLLCNTLQDRYNWEITFTYEIGGAEQTEIYKPFIDGYLGLVYGHSSTSVAADTLQKQMQADPSNDTLATYNYGSDPDNLGVSILYTNGSILETYYYPNQATIDYANVNSAKAGTSKSTLISHVLFYNSVSELNSKYKLNLSNTIADYIPTGILGPGGIYFGKDSTNNTAGITIRIPTESHLNENLEFITDNF